MRDRGQSEVIGAVLLVGVVVISISLVSVFVVSDVLSNAERDRPLVEYEFDYDPTAGLIDITQVDGESLSDAQLDSITILVRTDGRVERETWGSLVGPQAGSSIGSSVSVDDPNGADIGSFTLSSTLDTGTTVSVLYTRNSNSFVLDSYTVPEDSRSYVRWDVPTNGLDAYYPLDEAAVDIADTAGSAGGTVRGDPTLGAGGQVDTALEFDDNGDYVALDRSYDTAGGIEHLSACAWFRTSDTSGDDLWDNWAFIDFDRSEYFNLYTDGRDGEVGFSTSGPTSKGVDHFTSTDYADGTWHHACGTYNATSNRKRIYVDGTLEVDVTATNTDGLGTGNTRYGFIGTGSEASSFDGDRNGHYYDGRIDDVRIYDVALNQSQVQSVYDAGTGGGSAPTTGLVNYWPLEETSTESLDTATDAAGSGDGTVVGSSTTGGVSGRLGSAYEFADGSGHVALDRSFASEDIGNVTACAWFKTDETDTGDQNWAFLDFDRSEYFTLYVEGDGDIGWSTSAVPGFGSGEVDDLYVNGGYNDGAWYHACGVYDGDKRVVVDGSVAATRTDPHSDTVGTGAVRYGFIGDGSEASSFDGDRNEFYYEGTVDEVRLYGRAVSTSELERLWAFTGGAPSEHVTVTRSFPTGVNLSNLRLEQVQADRPPGTSIKVQVTADTNGDGTFTAESGNITLDGSGVYSVSGLSGTAEEARLKIYFTPSGGDAPTVTSVDLAVD